MTPSLIWSNVLAYALQIGVLIGLAALAPAVFRIRMPRARLLYWQILLVVCLALPWLQTWRHDVVAGAVRMTAVITTTAVAATPIHRAISFPMIALWLLAAGMALRLGLLIFGLARLSAYRRRGAVLPEELRIPGARHVEVMLSEDVAGPVTFGWRHPVVLLPASFTTLEGEMRDAILCHELQHVERCDWLFTIAEEFVRSVLWFHPAVWWVIGEIQLAREQTVDRSVIEMTQAREPYVDALLLMAGAISPAQPDLASAPMFLRRRHLKRRLVEVMKEVRMSTVSKTKLWCAMGAAAAVLAAACWIATCAFPLIAAPQTVNDAAGVAVNTSALSLIHRSPVPYPAEARQKGIEGSVVVQLKLDANGEVADASVLSGPDELRKGVLQSVLAWHFEKSVAQTTQVVTINFAEPAGAPAPPKPQLAQTQPANPPAPAVQPRLSRIVVNGVSDSAVAEIVSSLPVQQGDTWTSQSLEQERAAVSQFDSHLSTGLSIGPGGQLSLKISAPSNVYSVGNGVKPPQLLVKFDPQYSEEARTAKYSGSVELQMVVGTDGKATDINVVKSLGMGLDEKAVEALRKWVFQPGTYQGSPVNVRAMVDVNFRLL